MKKLLLVFTLFCSIAASAQLELIILDAKKLRENRSRVNNKDESLSAAYKELIKDADKALNQGPFSVTEKKQLPPSGDKHDYMSLAPYHWPDPGKKDGLPYIRKDGQTNPEVKEYKDKEYLPIFSDLVYTLSLAYYFSGNEAYAQHASLLIKTWFLDTATRMNPNLNYAQAIKGEVEGRGAGIIDARHFMKVIESARLLNGSKKWKTEDLKNLKTWFTQFLNWLQTSPNGIHELNAKNNHGTWYDAQRLAYALFIDSTNLAKKIVASAQERLDYQMDNEGKFPKEMERTIALHYTVFNLDAYFMIASMADKLGTNFWNYTSPSGKSLKKGFDFIYPILIKEKEWTGQQIKPFDFENAYFILAKAGAIYKCKKCMQAIKEISDEKINRNRLWLLY